MSINLQDYDFSNPFDYNLIMKLMKSANSNTGYHCKNYQSLIRNSKITNIHMIKDTNGYSYYWRYLWQEDNMLYMYTGSNVLGKDELTLLEKDHFAIDNVEIIVKKGNYYYYVLHLKHH